MPGRFPAGLLTRWVSSHRPRAVRFLGWNLLGHDLTMKNTATKGFHKGGSPIAGWLAVENAIIPLFQETSNSLIHNLPIEHGDFPLLDYTRSTSVHHEPPFAT